MQKKSIRQSSSPSGYARSDADWLMSSLAEPCPVCGGAESCHRHSEHGFASCVRTVSEWPLTTGAWLHPVAPATLHPLAPATTSSLGALAGPREPV